MDVSQLTDLLVSNSYLFAIILAAFFGEVAILSLTVLATQGLLPFSIVFFSAFFGTLIGDSLWFTLGAHLKKKNKIKNFRRKYNKIGHIINGFFKHNIFVFMMIMKYVYAARTLSNMYLGGKMKYSKFITYDVPVVFVWAGIMLGVGYLIGQGFAIAETIFKSFEIALLVIIGSIVVFYLLESKLNKFLFRSGR